ncbi:MAG: hypothetical protein CXT69_03035 [Methanobacteriota archaeon]|jgi:tetratricopeptide (TPR) repeat protein|nr:MAG: hypothetical protein CXT69_03035 [Euryarchaeota archaeon]
MVGEPMSDAGPTQIDMHKLVQDVEKSAANKASRNKHDADEQNDPQEANSNTMEDIAMAAMDTDSATLSSEESETSDVVDDDFGEEYESNPSEDSAVAENYELTDLIDEGEYLSREGDFSAALSVFNKAIAVDPSCDTAWFNRGVLLEGNGDIHGARQSFAITLDVNKDHAPAAANLAIILDRLGETADAGKWAQVALKTYSTHAMLIEVVERSGMNITPVAEVTPSPAPVAKEVAAPVAETPEVVEVDIDALVEAATTMLKQGDADGAFNLLKGELYSSAAKSHAAWNISAGALARMGHIDKSIASYKYALKLNDLNQKAWHNIGALHKRQGEINDAIDCFSRAFSLDPNYQKAAESLRTTLMDSGRVEEALDVWEAMIEANQPGVDALSFAETLIQMAKGEANALEFISELPPTMPEGPSLAQRALKHISTQDSPMRANALSLCGEHVEAVTIWKELLQIEAENASYWLGLASALNGAGDETTAQKCREKANALSGDVAPVVETAPEPVSEPEPASTPEPVSEPEPASTPEPEPTSPVAIENDIEEDEVDAFAELSWSEEEVEEKEVEEDSVTIESAANSLLEPIERPVESPTPEVQTNPLVDLAKVALDAAIVVGDSPAYTTSTSAIGNDIEWYNKGLGLIHAEKYREALSCLDRALPSFKNDDEMVIRILNARGNAFYYLEDYPKTIENYHQAMMINPQTVSGRTLYNMGTAYAEMERFDDAMKCYEQAMPRGLSKDEEALAKEQIRRCTQLKKEMLRQANKLS